MELAIYKNLCPNCSGEISSERLEAGLVCEKCLPYYQFRDNGRSALCRLLSEEGRLKNYRWVCDLESKLKKFEDFFFYHVNYPLWSVQRLWAKRVFAGESFAMVAPTGVGKTTFGIAMAHFLEGKAYIIVPTRMLVGQILDKSRLFGNKKVVAYLGDQTIRKTIEQGDYQVLITTSMFLSKNFELVKHQKFDFIFVDDVDALLKSGRNVDKILTLLGFEEQQIQQAWNNIRKRVKGKTQVINEIQDLSSSDITTEPFENGEKEQIVEFNDQRENYQPKSILVVSSATLRPRTRRVALFRSLLGFEITPVKVTIRNICDAVEWIEDGSKLHERVIYWIRKLGKGGLVFVSVDLGREGVEQLVNYLKNSGIRAVSYDEVDFDAFEKGDITVAVGIALISNALVRGIDLPETVRYSIFVDVPKISFPVDPTDPKYIGGLLFALREVTDEKLKLDSYLNKWRRYSYFKSTHLYPQWVREVMEYLNEQFNKEEILQKLQLSESVELIRKDNRFWIVVGDSATYLQASGRTSRLYAGGISRGISLILAVDKKAFYSLRKRIRLFYDEIEFQDAEAVDWDEELKKVDVDRQKMRLLKEKPSENVKLPTVTSVLVIVESPNKARTIARFFGTPQQRVVNGLRLWEVTTGEQVIAITASLGHVFDLVEQEGLYGVVQLNGRFVPLYNTIKTCMECGRQTTEDKCWCGRFLTNDKVRIIKGLQHLAVQFDRIIIATDPDAEGEKISYDLMAAIRPFNSNIVRAEFHEVTRSAFMQAIKQPRSLLHNLVKAQLTRRILDRWVGFELSRKLWEAFDRNDLSAGRVQTPVLGWIISRSDLSKQKKARIIIQLTNYQQESSFQLNIEEEDIHKARKILQQLDTATIVIENGYEQELNPPPPYTTASLLADAGGFASATEVMNVLQELFEQGLITYHRTDSLRVSDTALKIAQQLISEHYDHTLFKGRRYSDEGAHECIRPTKPLTEDELRLWLYSGRISLENPKLGIRLYGMILRRFLASQMKPTKVRKNRLCIQLPEGRYEWELITEVLDSGYERVLPLRIFPLQFPLQITDKKMRLISKIVPFTQGSLVEQMRQHGLGRPSTYAKIVQTLLERRYIVEKNGYLFATELGRKVYQWLRNQFPRFADESLTRELEEQTDLIEAGLIDYQAVLIQLRGSELFS